MAIDRDTISYKIGQRLLKYRTQRKMSQEELALASDIHPAYLGRVERGEKCPTVQTLYKISLGLKVPLSELIDISADIMPTSTEAFQRIENAMHALKPDEAIEIAEVIERIIKFKYK